jgi:hypothetical protein
MGAPDSLVRQLRHPTVRVLTVSTVGALTFWGTGQSVPHRTGTVHYPVRFLATALTLHKLSVHCSTFAGVRCSRSLRWSRCSSGAPDSPVNYSGAAHQKPEGGKFEVIRPWAPDTVRCARPGFSSVSFAPFFLNSNLIFLLVCVEPLAPVEYII